MKYCATPVDTRKAEIKVLKPAVINANGLLASHLTCILRRISETSATERDAINDGVKPALNPAARGQLTGTSPSPRRSTVLRGVTPMRKCKNP